MRPLTIPSRSTGSSHQTGSGAIIALTWLPSAPCPSGARTLTGTIASSSSPLVSWPIDRRCRPRAPETTVSTTSLTVPPCASLTRLKSMSGSADPGEAAIARRCRRSAGSPGRPCRGRRTRRWPRSRRAGRPGPGAGRGRGPAPRAPARPAGWLARPAPRRAAASRSARAGRPRRGGARRGGVGLGVEEDRGYVDPGDAVDQAVVGLADDREAVVLEPVDQPQLPQRLGPVEALGEGAGGEVAQLLLAAGGGEGGVADVVVEVQVGVVDPDRAGPGRRGRSGASGGSAGPGAGATRGARGTPRSRAAGRRRSSSRRRACGPRRARGAGRRRRGR